MEQVDGAVHRIGGGARLMMDRGQQRVRIDQHEVHESGAQVDRQGPAVPSALLPKEALGEDGAGVAEHHTGCDRRNGLAHAVVRGKHHHVRRAHHRLRVRTEMAQSGFGFKPIRIARLVAQRLRNERGRPFAHPRHRVRGISLQPLGQPSHSLIAPGSLGHRRPQMAARFHEGRAVLRGAHPAHRIALIKNPKGVVAGGKVLLPVQRRQNESGLALIGASFHPCGLRPRSRTSACPS